MTSAKESCRKFLQTMHGLLDGGSVVVRVPSLPPIPNSENYVCWISLGHGDSGKNREKAM